jgi:hypothetical protein
MTRVVSVGGIGTLLNSSAQPEDEAPRAVNVGVVLFAKLDFGRLVFDPLGRTLTMAPVESAQSPEELEALLHASLTDGDLSAYRGTNHWRRVLAALDELGVNTDADTLMQLPFELLLDREASSMLGPA